MSDGLRSTPDRGPRRVLISADAVGGVWTYVLELARGLARADVEVILAVMGPRPSESQHAEAQAIAGLQLAIAPFKLEWMDDPWRDVDDAGDWLRALENRHAPDLIHLNGYAHGALSFRAPKLVVGHSCVTSWWEAVRGGAPPERFSTYGRRVRAGLDGADAIVAPSRWMLAALQRHYGLRAPARVIPNGRDPADFPPGDKEPFVFAAGRLWDEAKNATLLARAADRLPWPVVMAGDTDGGGGGRGSEFTGGVAGAANLRMVGRLSASEMTDAYGRAAIFASPARYEPFGLSALEAALAGCALVLGDIPPLRELWQESALFVDPDDQAELGAALGALIHDPFARGAAAARCRQRALQLTAQRMCDAYRALYRDLLTGAPIGAGALPELEEGGAACAS